MGDICLSEFGFFPLTSMVVPCLVHGAAVNMVSCGILTQKLSDATFPGVGFLDHLGTLHLDFSGKSMLIFKLVAVYIPSRRDGSSLQVLHQCLSFFLNDGHMIRGSRNLKTLSIRISLRAENIAHFSQVIIGNLYFFSLRTVHLISPFIVQMFWHFEVKSLCSPLVCVNTKLLQFQGNHAYPSHLNIHKCHWPFFFRMKHEWIPFNLSLPYPHFKTNLSEL